MTRIPTSGQPYAELAGPPDEHPVSEQGEAPRQDRDDRERHREVRERAHPPLELLGVAELVQALDVGPRCWCRPERPRSWTSVRPSFPLPPTTGQMEQWAYEKPASGACQVVTVRVRTRTFAGAQRCTLRARDREEDVRWAIDSPGRCASSPERDPGSGGPRPSAWPRRGRASRAWTSSPTPSARPPARSATRRSPRSPTSPTTRRSAATRTGTVERWGRLDVAFNNAGVNLPTVFHEAPDDLIDRTIAVNLKGVIYGCRAAIPHMLGGGGGSIINTGSVNSLVSEPFLSIYAATKGAILMLSQEHRARLRQAGHPVQLPVSGVGGHARELRARGDAGWARARLRDDRLLPADRASRASRGRSRTSCCSWRATSPPS